MRIVCTFGAQQKGLWCRTKTVLFRVETDERHLIDPENARKQTFGDVAMILDAMREPPMPCLGGMNRYGISTVARKKNSLMGWGTILDHDASLFRPSSNLF